MSDRAVADTGEVPRWAGEIRDGIADVVDVLRSIRRWMAAGVGFGALCVTLVAGVIIAAQGPLRQLEHLIGFQRDVIALTCDSTLRPLPTVTPQLTPEQQERQALRLARVCRPRG